MTRRWPWRDDDPLPEGRPVRSVRDSLRELAADLELDDPGVVGTVMSHWPELVGEAVAVHTRPRMLRQGILTVEVDSPEWATQMRFLEDEILLRLGRRLRPGVVTSLRVKVRRR